MWWLAFAVAAVLVRAAGVSVRRELGYSYDGGSIASYQQLRPGEPRPHGRRHDQPDH